MTDETPMPPDDLHPCPARDCGQRIPFEQMACRPHWYALPPDLRRRVTRAWRGGHLRGTLLARREVEAVLNGTPSHD